MQLPLHLECSLFYEFWIPWNKSVYIGEYKNSTSVVFRKSWQNTFLWKIYQIMTFAFNERHHLSAFWGLLGCSRMEIILFKPYGIFVQDIAEILMSKDISRCI